MLPFPAALLDRLVEEDVPFGDLTTRALGIGDQPGRILLEAGDDLVACATEEAALLLERFGASARCTTASGRRVCKGTLLVEATGPAEALLAGWKVAQTLVEWSSGIATAVDEIVVAARAVSPRIVVACTRKAAPLTRAISVKAVIAGGGEMHRLGLSDTLLVFPEHCAFLPDDDLASVVARLRVRSPERSIVVEVTTEADALAAAAAGVDVLQLEKFWPDTVARIVRAVARRPDGRPIIAAAGGINAGNAGVYAAAGADVLVTSAPYWAKPMDVHVRIAAASIELKRTGTEGASR